MSEINSKRSAWLWALPVAVVIAGLIWWWLNRHSVSTDDAFVQADITLLAPRVPGTVTSVKVQDNQTVRAGDLLLELDPAEYQSRLRQAEANLEVAKSRVDFSEVDLQLRRKSMHSSKEQAQAALRSADAQAERAKADVQRYESLYAKDEISLQLLDQSRTALRERRAEVDQATAQVKGAASTEELQAYSDTTLAEARAAVAQAAAAVEQARLQLSYTRLLAPADGFITRKNVQPGQQVQAGTPVLAIVGSQPWVVANFKETQLQHMRVGQPVKVTVDAYPGRSFSARVDSLQAGTGSAFSLLPAENATGNFVKVVQRVPVKLVFDAPPEQTLHLVPGMSAEPVVDVSDDRHGAQLVRSSTPP